MFVILTRSQARAMSLPQASRFWGCSATFPNSSLCLSTCKHPKYFHRATGTYHILATTTSTCLVASLGVRAHQPTAPFRANHLHRLSAPQAATARRSQNSRTRDQLQAYVAQYAWSSAMRRDPQLDTESLSSACGKYKNNVATSQ